MGGGEGKGKGGIAAGVSYERIGNYYGGHERVFTENTKAMEAIIVSMATFWGGQRSWSHGTIGSGRGVERSHGYYARWWCWCSGPVGFRAFTVIIMGISGAAPYLYQNGELKGDGEGNGEARGGVKRRGQEAVEGI